MEAVNVCPIRLFRYCFDIDSPGDWINYRGAGDADLGYQIGAIRIVGGLKIHRGLARRGTMSGIDHANMPELRSGVGIESVDAVAFRRHVNNVMRPSRNRDTGHVERLSVNVPVHRHAENLAECGGIYIGWSEDCLT